MGMSGNEVDGMLRATMLGDGPARSSLLDQIGKRLTDSGWQTGDVFGIQMAVEESVSNAYRHGNQDGKLGEVEIGWRANADEFLIEVRDHGAGFDESAIPDPTDPANLEELTGRGLLLMRNYMNEVNFRDGGSTVIMRKTRAENA